MYFGLSYSLQNKLSAGENLVEIGPAVSEISLNKKKSGLFQYYKQTVQLYLFIS